MYQEIIKNKMFEALKAKDKPTKDAYAILFDALKKKEVDLRRPLSEAEEVEVIAKVVKQCKDTIASVPEGQGGAFIEKTKFELSVYEQFLPKQMSEEEIAEIIKETMAECNIETLTAKDKGLLMKNLMPKVKGKADGKLVSQLVAAMCML